MSKIFQFAENSLNKIEYSSIEFLNGKEHFQIPSKVNTNRFLFYTKTISKKVNSLAELELHLLKKEQFWLDVLDPTEEELFAIGKAFDVHSLTIEDIQASDTREKCDVFPNYYFIEVKSIAFDESSVKSVPVSILVFSKFIISIQYQSNQHSERAFKRFTSQISKFKKDVSPNYVCYCLLDEITDTFMPINKFIQQDIDTIDDLVAMLKSSEQTDMLQRISIARKRVMLVARLMNSKPELIRLVLSRMVNDHDIQVFLENIYDHVLTMKQDLNVFEKSLARSHSNYLAQINIEITQVANRGNELVMKLTILASIMYPMNVIAGMWGMNVHVPGQLGTEEGHVWFFSLLVLMIATSALTLVFIHRFMG
jgi:magnesium transporter